MIRPSAPADTTAILALLESSGLPTADLTGAHSVQMWSCHVGKALAGVIGLQRFGTDGLLRSLVVASAYRHRGFGRDLVTELEQHAREAGVAQLVLLTATAESFFRGLGYDSIDRGAVGEALKQSAEFRSLCPKSAVCMRKVLRA